MKGRWIYAAAASLLGNLTSLLHPAIAVIFSLLALFLLKRNILTKKTMTVLIMIYLALIIRSELAAEYNRTSLTGNESDFEITLSESVKIDGDLLTVLIELTDKKEKLAARYKIKSEAEQKFLSDHLRIGMTCRVNGTLQTPPTSTNPNSFSYKDYLSHNRIFWILELEQLNLSDCIYNKSRITLPILKMREMGTKHILEHFPEQAAPLSIALVFGDRNFIDEDIIASYQKIGIIHLLAISGLHVGMLAGMFFLAGVRAGITTEKMTSILIMVLPVYAILTGAAPSVLRAVFMMLLVLLAKKLKATIQLADVISIVFAGYLFISPFIIYNAGFQLSFAVALSLILSAPAIFKKFTHPLAALLSVSLICQIAAIPILLWHFYEVSIISIIANLIFVPLYSSIVLPVVLILFIFDLLTGGRADFLLHVLEKMIVFLNWIAEMLSAIPNSTLILGRPSPLMLIIYLFLIPAFFAGWERSKNKKAIIKNGVLPILAIIIHYLSNVITPAGEITFIDVGQGDSILIKLPYGRGNYLIDAGGAPMFESEDWKMRSDPYETGMDTVVPFLKSKGISEIDKFFLTHGDMDHIGGASAVLKEMKVKSVVFSQGSEFSEAEKDLAVQAKNSKSEIFFTKAGDSWLIGDSVFQVLSPFGGEMGDGVGQNDGSIVLFAKVGGLNWLFTGDLEEQGEGQLIKSYPKLKADVVKIAHHGSKTSSTDLFLAGVKPRIGVISAGRNNRYGHPHNDVMSRLNDYKVKVLRTDKQGAITYFFKGDSGTFSVQLP
ncbi:DNA internalization-related competence protein ComEC/Rec2 [Paenibacillus sp. FSL R5-0490]|uniref:DNA internalization-related competence protein ComEC/Rec2 n=1 Tax=Paenibacillus sp. FSL R5-0490 TaxID=1920424 RepID=UPI00096E7126|nr:DNA internalization-related competence protein ComEC/Rec2 [Paenibacillus sp. FSL R5-0490]OMF61896.1 DNA internalization-related competence protein ComEC/Rec2 [Paenibacillus sp. FSL R5-0490]